MTGRPVNPLFLEGLRKCNACHEIKTLESFSRAGNTTGYQYTCKPCAAESVRKSYQANPGRHRATSKARKDRLLAEVRALKTGPCTDCGQCFPPVCMDFDHLEDKIEGVASMVSRGFAREALLAEIAKCDLVCSNCHRIRTATRLEQQGVA